MDTLIVALRTIEKSESPIRHIHPVTVRESNLNGSGRDEFDLGGAELVELNSPAVRQAQRDALILREAGLAARDRRSRIKDSQ